MSSSGTAGTRGWQPPAPEPGSARFFALLYTPADRRSALARLIALADEIGAGGARRLDHEVAHARLEWWRLEAARYAEGHAQHPWLQSASAAAGDERRFDLRSLVEAAAIDLAEALQRPEAGGRLRGALFAAAAEHLGAEPLSAALREALSALGTLSWQIERAALAARRANPEQSAPQLQAALERLGTGLQPTLAPLLVWVALAAARKNHSPLRAFADNIRAWRVARRAATGRYTSR